MATTTLQEQNQTTDATWFELPSGSDAHGRTSNGPSEFTDDDDLDELAESPNSVFEDGAFANGEWFEAVEVGD